MPSGGGTPKVKPSTAESQFGKYNSYAYNLGDFGGASVGDVRGQLRFNANLNPKMQGIMDNSRLGLEGSLGVLKTPFDQQLQALSRGENSYYNLNSEMNRRMLDQSISDATSRYSSSGLENSTVRGAMEGRLLNDAMLQDLATRQSSLEFMNNQANTNAATQQNALSYLSNLLSGQQSGVSNVAMQGMSSQDQMSMFNAQQIQEANKINAQMQQQAQAQKQAMIGNMIKTGLSLAAIPLTGGLSGLGALGGAASAAGGAGGLLSGGLSGLSGVSSLSSMMTSPSMFLGGQY